MSANNYEFLDRGYTSTVFRIPGTQTVCKSFLPGCTKTHLPAEIEAYERFTARGHPATILKYYGVDKDDPAGIVLELVENGNLYNYLWDTRVRNRAPPSPDTLYRWARQAAGGLAFSHSCGVFHSDIYCSNFLLDDNMDLKVVDFAGASIDGSTSWSHYRTTHSLPRPKGKPMEITTATEIFAFGSALYHMIVGYDLYPELHHTRDREEIKRRLQEKEFPNVSQLLVLASVVTKCWNLEYKSMADVIEGIEAERSGSAV